MNKETLLKRKPQPSPRYLSLSAACMLLDRSRATILKWIEQGCPVVTKADKGTGQHAVLDVAEVVRWLEARAAEADAPSKLRRTGSEIPTDRVIEVTYVEKFDGCEGGRRFTIEHREHRESGRRGIYFRPDPLDILDACRAISLHGEDLESIEPDRVTFSLDEKGVLRELTTEEVDAFHKQLDREGFVVGPMHELPAGCDLERGIVMPGASIETEVPPATSPSATVLEGLVLWGYNATLTVDEEHLGQLIAVDPLKAYEVSESLIRRGASRAAIVRALGHDLEVIDARNAVERARAAELGLSYPVLEPERNVTVPPGVSIEIKAPPVHSDTEADLTRFQEVIDKGFVDRASVEAATSRDWSAMTDRGFRETEQRLVATDLASENAALRDELATVQSDLDTLQAAAAARVNGRLDSEAVAASVVPQKPGLAEMRDKGAAAALLGLFIGNSARAAFSAVVILLFAFVASGHGRDLAVTMLGAGGVCVLFSLLFLALTLLGEWLLPDRRELPGAAPETGAPA